MSVHPSPFSSSQGHCSKFLLSTSPCSPLRFLHRFLPSMSRYGDHRPEERQAHETSHTKAEVQALSDIVRRFPRGETLQQSGMRLRSFCPENRMTCDCKVDRFILPHGWLTQGL